MRTKVLFIDSPLDPPGGGQISLLLILKHLNKKIFEPQVFIHRKREFADILEKENIPYQIVRLRNLCWAIKKFNPSIVHCNSATTKYAFRSALISKFLRIPSVWHVRVTDSAGWKDKIIAMLTKKIVVVSDAVGEKFGWMKQKIVKIYNAVDTKIFKPGLDTGYLFDQFNIERSIKVVAIFSRLDPWKGHILFFDSAKIIKGKVRDTKFLVVGTGKKEYRNYLTNYVEKLGLKDDIIFTGKRYDIPQLMNLCDVVINPSIKPEPFGRTIIEAMACGKPIVSTNMGGPKEIIDNNIDGFLVSPKPQKIAEAIIKVLNDQNLYTIISTNAIQKVNSKFGIEVHIQQIEDLYRELLIK